MREINYQTELVCSSRITIYVEDDIIKKVKFYSGCPGNLQGISKLVEGMKAEDVIKKLKGIDCSGKGTSCPDQLAKALEKELGSRAFVGEAAG